MMELLPGPMPASDLVAMASGWSWSMKGQIASAGCLDALQSLLSKKLLVSASHKSISRRRKAMAIEVLLACDQSFGDPGMIEYSVEGYKLFGKWRSTIGMDSKSGARIDFSHRVIDVFGSDELSCQGYAEYVKSNVTLSEETPETGAVCRLVLAGASHPKPVGRWRYNRFEVMNSGYHIELKYHER
jgi:hypothetical protein